MQLTHCINGRKINSNGQEFFLKGKEETAERWGKGMNTFKLKKFMQDESGQTTTEYILMLAVLVTIFMQFKKKLSAMLNGLMSGVEGKAARALEEDE